MNRTTLCFMALLAFVPPVAAQEVPSSVQPGQIERQFERPPEARAVDDLIILEAPSQEAPTNASSFVIQLNELRIQGATRFTSSELLAPYVGITGTRVPLTRIYDIANEITARYRNDGYVLSRAIVSEQRLTRDNATATINVVEGYVADIDIRGDVAGRRGMLNKMAADVVAERPHRQEKLERFLLLLNDMAGATAGVTGTYVPIENQPGAFRVVVLMAQDRFSVTVGQTNRGSELLGPNQTEIGFGLNSILGWYEQTTFRYITAGSGNKLDFYSLGQSHWLGASGAKLNWQVNATESTPELGADFQAFNLETESTSGSIGIEYPLRRTRRSNLDLRLNLTYHDGKTEDLILGVTQDQIAAVRAGMTLDWIDSMRGVNLIDVELSQGFEALGANELGNPNVSRTGGLQDFWKVRAYLARVQSLGGPVSVLLAAEGQFTDDILLSPEEFSIGGATFGRAYDASELVGDTGAAGKVEFRMQFGSSADRGSRAMIYGFYESGFVVNEVAAVGRNRKESLTATGGGIRFSLFGWLNGYVEAAVPVTRPVAIEGNDDTRVFGGITLQF